MSLLLLTVRPSLYFASKTDIAAREPEPIVANGRVSVEPCGYICVLVKADKNNNKTSERRKTVVGNLKNLQYADEAL